MPDARRFPVLRRLQHLVSEAKGDALPDAVLLDRFTRGGDRDALAVLVRRYGPLVWRVCRRVLGDSDAAQDAFQATVLVLMRKASSIRTPAALAAWLHKTAFRIACTAKAARRKGRSGRAADRPTSSTEPSQEAAWRELGSILEQEVHALPEKLRLPVLLCYWQGLTNEEAAAQLGWSSGTLKGRLAQARTRLHQRLVRRGVTLPVGVLALLLAPVEADAALSGTLRVLALRVFDHGAAAVGARAALLADLAYPLGCHAKLGTVMTLVLGLSALSVGLWLHGAADVSPAPADAGKPPSAAAQAKLSQQQPARTDRYGDALPPGALLRLGTVRNRALQRRPWRTQLLPDGKVLLRSAGSTTTAVQDEVQWVETDTGRITDTWAVPGRPVICGFSPDGHRVLVCDNRAFQLWDLGTRQQVRTFGPIGEPATGYRAVFSPDGKVMATCDCVGAGGDAAIGQVRVWDVHTGKRLWTVGKTGELGPYLIGFVPKGPLMAFFDPSGNALSLRDSTTGEVVRSFATTDLGRCHVLSPDGKACVISTGDAVRVWELDSGKELPPLRGHKQRVSAIAFHPGRKLLMTGGDDPTVLVWDWPSCQRRQELDVGTGEPVAGGRVQKLGFSADGKRAYVVTEPENAARWFDLATGKELPRPAEAHNAVVWELVVAPDGRLVSTGYDDTYRVWDLDTGQQLHVHRVGRTWGATSLAVSGDGRLVATAEINSGTVRLKERDTGRLVRAIPTGGHRVNGMAFAPHRPLLAAGAVDEAPQDAEHRRRLVVWDTDSWKILRRLEDGSDPAFSPDGRYVAGFVIGPPQRGGNGKHPTIWDLATGLEKVRMGSDHYGAPAYSPDGRLLAVPIANGIRLLETASGQWCGSIAAPVYNVSCTVAFSPDSQRLAMPDGTGALVFDVLTGRQLHRLRRHLSQTTHVAFSPGGRRLVSASHDSTMLVWDVASTVQRGQPASTPNAQAIAAAWDDLAAHDAKKAFQAVRVLVEAPGPSISLLRDRLKAAAPADTRRLQQWIADLDSDLFDTRDAATRALEQGGPDAEQAIRTALDGTPTLEARRRLEQILRKLWATPTAEALRTVRAVWVLELIANSDARGVLQALARGAPAALRTREALAAIERWMATGSH